MQQRTMIAGRCSFMFELSGNSTSSWHCRGVPLRDNTQVFSKHIWWEADLRIGVGFSACQNPACLMSKRASISESLYGLQSSPSNQHNGASCGIQDRFAQGSSLMLCIITMQGQKHKQILFLIDIKSIKTKERKSLDAKDFLKLLHCE